MHQRPFEQLAEQLSLAVVIADRQGRISWTNRAFRELCGYTAEEVSGRKPGHFLQGGKTDPRTVERLKQALGRHEPVSVEILNYHKTGRPYWVRLNIDPLRDKAGRRAGYIAIEKEMTQEVRERSELECEVVEIYRALLHTTVNPRERVPIDDPFT